MEADEAAGLDRRACAIAAPVCPDGLTTDVGSNRSCSPGGMRPPAASGDEALP